MSDGGGAPEPGWYDDPRGQHRHRWWDGSAWTEQTSDGDAPAGRKVPVGVLAVAGLLVAVALVVVVLAVGGGDDGGSDDAAPATDDRSGDSEEDEGDEGSGPGEFDGQLDEDEPVATFPVELEAGDALRVSVDGLDTAVTIGASDEAATEGFVGLVAVDSDEYQERTDRQLLLVADDALDQDEYLAFENDYFADELEGDDLLEAVSDAAPAVGDAGVLFLGTDRSSDDVEGVQLVAPTSGLYTVVVTSGLEGSFDITLEVEAGDDEGLDPTDIEYADYLAHYGDHVDFFCDEDFFGGDPDDVTNYGPTICDPEELDGVLSGQFNGDFTNDFGGGAEFG